MGLLSDAGEFGKDVVNDRDKWEDRSKKVGGFLQSRLGQRVAKAAESPILAGGQHVIDGMKRTTGSGAPDSGDRFGHGAQRLGDIGQTLKAAFPNDGWDGRGSTTYTGRNNEQVSRTRQMISADQLVASVLSREARQIATTRDNLDSQSDWLGDMSLITMATGCVPNVGKAAQVAAEVAMVSKAVGESSIQLLAMQDNASSNAAEVRDAVSQYEAVADEAEPTGTENDFEGSADEADADPPAELREEPSDWAYVPTATSPVGASRDFPGGGGDTGAPTTQQPVSTPTGVPAGAAAVPAPAGMGSGGDIAGVIGAVFGSVLAPLGGLLGGVMQAAGQAAQVATQAAQGAGQAGPEQNQDALAAGADKDSERNGEDKDQPSEREKAQDRNGVQTGGEAEAGKPDAADPEGNSAGEGDKEAVKTLPPDLQAASADPNEAGLAPAHVGADFNQSQLRMPAAATLERGIPGSAAAIDT